MSPPDTEETFYWYFMGRVTPQEWVITEIRTPLGAALVEMKRVLISVMTCSWGVTLHIKYQ
jgi:hypothetical protein